jgi:hypothetical protein
MNEELKYREDNSLIILKIVVYFGLNLLCGVTAAYGYYVKPFEKTKVLVGTGSVIYLLLSGIWSLYLQYCATQTIYRGSKSNQKAIWLRSSTKHPQAIYRLEIVDSSTAVKAGKVVDALEVPVGDWIDVEGNVCVQKIFADLTQKLVPKFKFD